MVDGKCPSQHAFKRMCINCASCKATDDGKYICENTEVMEKVRASMLEKMAELNPSYKVEDLKIAPAPLKKPLSKCSQWRLDDSVLGDLVDLFV